MSSLATSLQSIASLDASRLTSRNGAPTSKSYLFPPKQAAAHDLDAIFALAQSGFEELRVLDDGMDEFEAELFSEAARRTDRMMLNKEENARLDVILRRCLRRLGKWIGLIAGGKCIEWLVRRYRVHEMNAETLLQVFLPYHQSPNFPRMLAILTIPTSSPYHAPFAALIKSAQPLPRSYITTAISPEKDRSLRLFTDAAAMVKQALDEGTVHRALLAFWTSTMVESLEKARTGKGVNEGMVKIMVEAFVTILSTRGGSQDICAAVFPPLILLTRTVRLADEPFLALLSAVTSPIAKADSAQRLLTLLVMLDNRPGWSKGLGENGPHHLTRVTALGQSLVAAMEKYGFEEGVRTILGVMIERPDLMKSQLLAVLNYQALPPSVIKVATSELVRIGPTSSHQRNVKAHCSDLLSVLRERHPAIVGTAGVGTNNEAGVGRDISKTFNGDSAIVNVYSADVASRIEGVREMTKVLLSGRPGQDKQSALDALLARLGDTDATVIAAVYEDSKALESVFATREAYINAVSPAFTHQTPHREILRSHLTNISANSYAGDADFERHVFDRLLFPCLFPTAQREPFGAEEWTIIVGGQLGKLDVMATLQRKLNECGAEGTDPRWRIALVQGLADGIRTSNDPDSYVEFLLNQLGASLANPRFLAQCILAQLLQSTQGESEAILAVKVLGALEYLRNGMALRDSGDLGDPLPTATIEAMHNKPDSTKTARRADVMLLGAMNQVVRPPGIAVSWLIDETWSVDKLSSSYKTFAYRLYAWANSDILPRSLATTLLQSLLIQVGDDALIFFASIWIDDESIALRVAALRHASAFIRAHAGTSGSDFQLVMPAILVALQDPEPSVREVAVELLRCLDSATRIGGSNIYVLDTIYAGRSELVQLLKQADLLRYLEGLVAVSAEMIIDPRRITSIHTDILATGHGKSRKETSHRRAVIGAILSHVNAWRHYRVRRILLTSLSGITDSSLFRGVLPLLSTLGDDGSEGSVWLSSLSTTEQAEYLEQLFRTLTPQSASTLAQDSDGEAWKTLLRIQENDAQSRFGGRLRSLALQRMADGGFAALAPAQKVAWVTTLIGSMHNLPTDETFTSKAVLQRYLLDPSAIIEVITHLLQSLETSNRAKRQKHDDDIDGDRAERAIDNITTFIDSRDWRRLPGDAPLVACLMSILSILLAKRQSVKEGVDYLEQEVLSAILAEVEKITDPNQIQKAHVGIEVIIKVIRASTNPRTSQRALLVASELARLIPNAVLHNVMPIFTFMGASDFQRDDAYSFGVVEKTVSRIVPVMTKSLREQANTKLELYNDSLSFISIFTDMAGRLPKHRTLPFFVHLVKCLEPNDFLAPVVMLLADRASAKVGRTGANGSQAAELPLALAASFDVDIRVSVIREALPEVNRLLDDASRPEKEAFLKQINVDSGEDDQTFRRIRSLLKFSTSLTRQVVGKACKQETVEEIVQELILLASKLSSSSFPSEGSDLVPAVQAVLLVVMQLLSASNFFAVISRLLGSSNDEEKKVALDVFVERLPLVKPDVRSGSGAAIGDILRAASALFTAHPSITIASMSAVRIVASTALDTEDVTLAESMPKLVEAVGHLSEVSALSSALSLIELLTRRLGSRMIPFIQPITQACLSIIRTSRFSASTNKQAFSTLSSLFETVPTFVGGQQITAILYGAISYRSKDEEVSTAVISRSSKKVPTKTLFPVVMEMWKTTQKEDESSMKAFFNLLRLTLRNANRDALASLIKPVFAFFLDVFDLRHRLQQRGFDEEVTNGIEDSAIGSFLELVTKLNETTFKPLFIRLYDWAVIDLAEGKPIGDARLVERKIVLFHVMMGLLQKFKHLLSPYIAILLPHIEELFPAFAEGLLTDTSLWTLLLDVLDKSFEVDDGAFWTDALQLKVVPTLVDQLPLFSDVSPSPVARTLASLAGSTTSEPVLKSINSAICLATRAENPKTRMATLRAMDAVWEKQAEEMLQFVPETVSEFLAELLEDENSEVEGLARKVLARIEKMTGSLKEYLQ